MVLVGVMEVSSSDINETYSESQKKRVWPDNLFGVDFVDNKNGWISGYAGRLLRTINGGDSWELIYIGRNELIRNIDFIDTQYGWAVGHRGSIFHTSDGGQTWVIQHNETGTYLRDISFIDRSTGWVVGHDATILQTTDGGQTWKNQKLTGYKGRDLPRLHAVVAEDQDNAFLVGEFGVISATSDGGKTWPVIKNKSKKTLLSIAKVADHFIAPGLDGTIAHISKGTNEEYDIQWLKTDTKEHFFAVSSAPNDTAIAVGRSIVVKIVGDTVSQLTTDESIALPFTWFGGVDALNDGSFWMAGIRGTIAKGRLDQSTFKFELSICTADRVQNIAGSGQVNL
jgi:photosystem II stability/assembly factor-like uncharacterized protein